MEFLLFSPLRVFIGLPALSSFVRARCCCWSPSGAALWPGPQACGQSSASAYVQYCDATVIMLAKLTLIEEGRLTVSAILAMLLQAEATRVHKLAHWTVSPVPPELLTWRDTHTGLVCSVEATQTVQAAMEPQNHHPPRPGSSAVYLCWKWS